MLEANRALVLLSGGQDSTTCLAWALTRYERVATIGFDYGQRHAVEMQCRSILREKIVELNPAWKARLGGDTVIDASFIGALGDTALTAPQLIGTGPDGLPTTFVPGRNLLFLSLAAVVAYRQGIKHLVTGVCETDYSGYPDCRDDTIKATQLAINGAMASQFVIHTPLMWIDKAATFQLAEDLGGAELVELILEHTHTCYVGERTWRHPWGYGCGTCPACALRQAGYLQWRKTTLTV